MPASYELYLADDSGRRLRSLKDISFFSYTRAVNGLGTCAFGLPLKTISDLKPYFQPDWRLEAWRSPGHGIPLRQEDVFMLRKPYTYTRQDSVQMIQFYGRNGVDLLKRRSVIQRAGTSYAKKTDSIDDLMKAYVRQQMLYGSALDEDGVVDNTRAWPQNEFFVQGDVGLGPSTTRDFADRNVFDVLKELKNISFQMNKDSDTNLRVYFDVVPLDVSALTTAFKSPVGWELRTYAGLRGEDRTGGIPFSLENGNLQTPTYALSHLEEVTAVIVRGNGQGLSQIVTSVEDAARLITSRWNRIEKVIAASSETTTSALQAAGQVELYKGKPEEKLEATFLSSDGGPGVPRSLYGLDWDLGDLVRVNYADKQFDAEISVVYVAVDENGKESITARNEVQT